MISFPLDFAAAFFFGRADFLTFLVLDGEADFLTFFVLDGEAGFLTFFGTCLDGDFGLFFSVCSFSACYYQERIYCYAKHVDNLQHNSCQSLGGRRIAGLYVQIGMIHNI